MMLTILPVVRIGLLSIISFFKKRGRKKLNNNNYLINRESFGKIRIALELPDLLDVQLKSFFEFLQENVPPNKRANKGLQAVFTNVFPITDARENFILEFLEYHLESPKYNVKECQDRGMTYSVPLKAKLRLSMKDQQTGKFSETIEQDVYLGPLPYMTNRGTFIINGAERVVVSQLHRSPGVFFDEETHPNGTKMYSARIIPFKGSWIEFVTDINDVMYVYIDRKKKFPVTTLLRALGYSSDDKVLELFHLIDEVDVDSSDIKDYYGKHIALDVVDKKTGEVLVEKNTPLSIKEVKVLRENKIAQVKLVKSGDLNSPEVITTTMRKDTAKTELEALEIIYKQMRSGDIPDLETAKSLIEKMFFNPKRYDLGNVGRYRLNSKLKLDADLNNTVLTKEDIIEIIKYLLDLKSGRRDTDDIDHLGNRRVKTVGEQLSSQFLVGLTKMGKTIRERMNLRDTESLTPQDLVNARAITTVINAFFGTSQLSQFMDQTNPLAELTHKRRLSALGPGGLTRERAGFEVRDVHYTHYGRLCPIETPEGPNIGLISSLCVYARINEFGFIETPYRKIEDGKVTNKIEYLAADSEEDRTIGQVTTVFDKSGKFTEQRIKARRRSDYPVVNPDEIDYLDVAPHQIVSAAAALIPFLEHNDANRALMGSNMQRQAVPLLKPEAPYVGTGLESVIARDSRAVLVSEYDGEVTYVSADKIVIKREMTKEDERKNIASFEDLENITYDLTKFQRTNQDTSINQRPLVNVGDKIKKGQILADGCGTDRGELALGRNVLVAFMPWVGYNFEDAIIISERVVRDDIYTSTHIEEFEHHVRETKRGEEELTREIPNVSEEATKNLDENGIVRVGAEVEAGDILVGKVTPKGETEPTPEEKLLRAIFGDKAGDVKDASLKAPPGMKGIVIDTKLFSRKKKDSKGKREEKKKLDAVEKRYELDRKDLRKKFKQKLGQLLEDRISEGVKTHEGKTVIRAGTKFALDTFMDLDPEEFDPATGWTGEKKIDELVETLYKNYQKKLSIVEEEYKREKAKLTVGDELPPGIVQLAKVYVAKKRKLAVGDKMAGRHGNKGVVAKIVPAEDMPFLEDGTPIDIILNPLGVPSRMNLGQIYETNLGWAAKVLNKFFASPVFDGASISEVKAKLKEAGLPEDGKVKLYDGRTGDPFDQKVTVGYIYMMKLSHLVDDKIHARSIGPYSLITQQPLGGKAQFGGQRFGEMEVWALEAYGAAYTLQEILTVKSDDVNGRAKVYEAIVKGENLPESSTPESFNVLIREMQGLGLDIKVE
jgi:DNA-directed RNA polymerase subunit beta